MTAGHHRGCLRIGVVSDTHLPQYGMALPRALRDGLFEAGVGLILHLGDFTEPPVAALFEALGPLDGVAGNNDGPELVARFGRRKVIDIGGCRIGLTHGDLGPGRTTPLRAARTFANDRVDAILYGHSHIPRIDRLADGRWLLNPGSPTAKRREPRYSWLLLEIGPDRAIQPSLQRYDDRAS